MSVKDCYVQQLTQSDSTNDDAFKLLEQHRTVAVWTDYQTSGRGSRGRQWACPQGCGLALSLGFYLNDLDLPQSFPYPIYAGVIVAQALKQVTPKLGFHLKWPNDVFVGKKKLAGILCESRWRDGCARTVVGIGININDHIEFNQLSQPVISLQAAQVSTDIRHLSNVLQSLFINRLGAVSPIDITQEWLSFSNLTPGVAISLNSEPQQSYEFVGLRTDGQLEISDAAGRRRVIQQHDIGLTVQQECKK